MPLSYIKLPYKKFKIIARLERWAKTQNPCSRFANIIKLDDDTYAAIMGNDYSYIAFSQANNEQEAIQMAWEMLTPLLSDMEEDEKQEKEKERREREQQLNKVKEKEKKNK